MSVFLKLFVVQGERWAALAIGNRYLAQRNSSKSTTTGKYVPGSINADVKKYQLRMVEKKHTTQRWLAKVDCVVSKGSACIYRTSCKVTFATKFQTSANRQVIHFPGRVH